MPLGERRKQALLLTYHKYHKTPNLNRNTIAGRKSRGFHPVSTYNCFIINFSFPYNINIGLSITRAYIGNFITRHHTCDFAATYKSFPSERQHSMHSVAG